MQVTVQEIYLQTIRPLSEQQRLELMAMIVNDLAHPQESRGAQKKLSELFGTVSLGHATNLDNEQIDADLASEYASTHEVTD
ncbi:MAG: hypothetical protein SF339_10160 [Blastocatellia bacterium]|nr:hypothetical protein [Blastocatellia bacterium]